MERQLSENRFVFTDLHLGEGKNNNLDYFSADEEFLKCISLIIDKYALSETPTELVLGGDTFDFLTVSYDWVEKNRKGQDVQKSRTLAEPTEEASLQKIRKIFDAHPKAIEALKLFLKHGKIKFFIGNHDISLAWPGVQTFIKEELAKELDPTEKRSALERISFAFKEKKCRVLFEHGNDCEPHCAMPKKIFLEQRLGQPLEKPLLNHPYGNHLLEIANRLATDTFWCKGNPWIGRLEPHWYVYLQSILDIRLKSFLKNWWFAIYAIATWLIAPFRHRFSRRWWVRKEHSFFKLFSFNLQAMLTTVLNKIRGQDSVYYFRELLKHNDDIDIIVSGHLHEHHQETTRHGTYINPGGWCESNRASFPPPKLTWRRFRRVEKFFKYIWTVRKLFHKKTRDQFLPKKCEVFGIVVCRFYNDEHKEVELMRYNPEKNCLEKLN
ncbi:metallophosphoesterase [Patescibacteria group bacterium]|nr:metallophosphoesterase [Patescibacteria group bacterium]